jgi:hypothetical protein
MTFSLRKVVELVLMVLKVFEIKRVIGVLKLATIEKVKKFGD